jgi:hypothetical protein
MEDTINFDKSIKKRRLIYKDRGVIVDYIITYAGSLLFITLGCMLLVSKFSVMPVVILILTVGFIAWMIANVILFNVLIKVNGKDINTNRNDVIKVLNEYFNLNIENNDQVIIRNVKLSGFIYWGRVITVLLDDDSVYINIQSLGRGDALSFFHGFTNYLKSKRIAKRFSQIQLQEITT